MPHINELIDYTVEVFVVFKDKVLLRSHDKYNLWLGVGGHIEPDENPNQAALREVKEEVGLDVILCAKLLPFKKKNKKYQELIPPFFLNIHRISKTHRHTTLVYFAKSNSGSIKESGRERSRKWKWMTKAQVQKADYLTAPVKFYALRALKELNKS